MTDKAKALEELKAMLADLKLPFKKIGPCTKRDHALKAMIEKIVEILEEK